MNGTLTINEQQMNAPPEIGVYPEGQWARHAVTGLWTVASRCRTWPLRPDSKPLAGRAGACYRTVTEIWIDSYQAARFSMSWSVRGLVIACLHHLVLAFSTAVVFELLHKTALHTHDLQVMPLTSSFTRHMNNSFNLKKHYPLWQKTTQVVVDAGLKRGKKRGVRTA